MQHFAAINFKGQIWWHTCVFPAVWEVEVEESQSEASQAKARDYLKNKTNSKGLACSSNSIAFAQKA
jgi:hypothetical protein